MRIIEDIQVTHFRSFLGTPKKYETKVAQLNDVNVFSGSNDSGKSNILRALNLFFNDEIAYGVPFNFERDFFAGKNDVVQKVIEISISFNFSGEKSRDNFLPEKFVISKYYNRDGFRNYTYNFFVKEINKEITIDSRPDNNTRIKDLFITPDSSEAQKRSAEKRELNYRIKFAGFLNKSVTFEYVPAIRDKNFFTHLFGRVISQAKNSEERKLEQLRIESRKINNWQKTLKNKSEKKDFKENIQNASWRESRLKEIKDQEVAESKFTTSIIKLENEINNYASDLIESILFLPNEFKVGKDLQDFFEGFDIGTGADKSISLNLRGDGLQAKFIPHILDFLSNIDKSNGYFIWGIEEPENSAEYTNQQELARDIKKKYSTSKQIFITTHSEEFLQLYDGSDVSKEDRRANLYHVKKLDKGLANEYSQVFLYDVDEGEFELFDQKSQLEYDLGQSYLRAKYSKELKETEDSFIKERKILEKKLNEYEQSLRQGTKPLLFVEDKYTELYKIAWLKLHNINFTKSNLDSKFATSAPFVIYTAEGASPLAGFLRAKNIDFYRTRKVIGLFDFDEEGKGQFCNVDNDAYWKVGIQGDKNTGLFKSRNGHDCFVALLLPIPKELETLADLKYPSFVEVENLLPKNFLTNGGYATESITTGNTKFIEVKDSKKSNIWKAAIDLAENDFSNFSQLFSTINKIFDIDKESEA